jgi:hypothetical protein
MPLGYLVRTAHCLNWLRNHVSSALSAGQLIPRTNLLYASADLPAILPGLVRLELSARADAGSPDADISVEVALVLKVPHPKPVCQRVSHLYTSSGCSFYLCENCG